MKIIDEEFLNRNYIKSDRVNYNIKSKSAFVSYISKDCFSSLSAFESFKNNKLNTNTKVIYRIYCVNTRYSLKEIKWYLKHIRKIKIFCKILHVKVIDNYFEVTVLGLKNESHTKMLATLTAIRYLQEPDKQFIVKNFINNINQYPKHNLLLLLYVSHYYTAKYLNGNDLIFRSSSHTLFSNHSKLILNTEVINKNFNKNQGIHESFVNYNDINQILNLYAVNTIEHLNSFLNAQI